MTSKRARAQPKIKGLGVAAGPESPVPQTQNPNSETEKRPRLRLRSLDDTLRAHARVLRSSWGKVDPDTYSRMLKRHSEMLAERYVQTMSDQVRELKALKGQPQRVIDSEAIPKGSVESDVELTHESNTYDNAN